MYKEIYNDIIHDDLQNTIRNQKEEDYYNEEWVFVILTMMYNKPKIISTSHYTFGLVNHNFTYFSSVMKLSSRHYIIIMSIRVTLIYTKRQLDVRGIMNVNLYALTEHNQGQRISSYTSEYQHGTPRQQLQARRTVVYMTKHIKA